MSRNPLRAAILTVAALTVTLGSVTVLTPAQAAVPRGLPAPRTTLDTVQIAAGTAKKVNVLANDYYIRKSDGAKLKVAKVKAPLSARVVGRKVKVRVKKNAKPGRYTVKYRVTNATGKATESILVTVYKKGQKPKKPSEYPNVFQLPGDPVVYDITCEESGYGGINLKYHWNMSGGRYAKVNYGNHDEPVTRITKGQTVKGTWGTHIRNLEGALTREEYVKRELINQVLGHTVTHRYAPLNYNHDRFLQTKRIKEVTYNPFKALPGDTYEDKMASLARLTSCQ